MSLLLAPYNNAMRLGQGFNSYTQQICVDDAVVIDPDRLDNHVTNDGFTMRDLRFAIGAREGGLEHVVKGKDDSTPVPAIVQPSPPSESPPSDPSDSTTVAVASENVTTSSIVSQIEQQARTISKLVEDIAKLENELEDAIGPASMELQQKALLLEKKKIRLTKLKTQETSHTMKVQDVRATANELANRGPSQIVTYTSRFVNKLSQVTDDMNISGSLSIKYGVIGGKGKGSFIDSDKFKESDLNFFISVKVINQSINIKDALVYQGLPSVDSENFTEVFGDCFISGFLEGGEFNAIVSMKILNQEKRTAISAEAKIALPVGAGQIKAKAKVDMAKSNINANTETTIQVGWSGGGHIKPMDQPWTIQSLMETAARFPDLVALTPQRTYAILTKYESLRSFLALKPPKLSPIMYENAAIYTNALLDAYMEYKNIYRNISIDLFDLQAGTKVFEKSMALDVLADNQTLTRIDDESKFSSDYKGLDLARRACRFQMIKIVNEVDAITKNPKIATDELRGEQYQGPIAFKDRLPKIHLARAPPQLSIYGDEEKVYPPLLENKSGSYISQEETDKVAAFVAEKRDISEHLRLAPMVGSDEGTLFSNLDFIKPNFLLLQVTVEISDGVVSGMTTRYSNGLVTSLGSMGSGTQVTLYIHPDQGEKIIACSIEVGHLAEHPNAKDRITAIRLYTNRGPDLLGHAEDWKPAVDGKGVRGGLAFEGLTLTHFDPLITNGHIKGFWGRSVNTTVRNKRTGLYRLGPMWGDIEDNSVANVRSGLDDDDDESIKPQSGSVIGLDLGWTTDLGCTKTKRVQFGRTLPSTPTILYGFRKLDIAAPYGPCVNLEVANSSKQGFDLTLSSWNTSVRNIEANWMVLPDNDIHFEHGEVDSSEFPDRPRTENARFRIYFSKPYKANPMVYCWFTRININKPNSYSSLRCKVTNVTPRACTINTETWLDRGFDGAKVMWLAWDSEHDGKNIRGDNSHFYKDTPVQDYPWYNGSFSRQPEGFTAMNLIDFPPQNRDLHMQAVIHSATKERLRWEGGSWGDTLLDGLGLTWMAMC